MKIKFLKANHGDSIHIRFQDDESNYRNILIDGGSRQTYEYRKGNKKKDGELKQLINEIREQKEHIDLLILTHVDRDHIEGILTWFEKDELAYELVKKVWFNSGRLIQKHFKANGLKSEKLELNLQVGKDTGIDQGVTFEKYIEKHNIWDSKLIKSGDAYPFYNLFFQIVSPNEEALENLLGKWDDEAPIRDTAPRDNEYDKPMRQLLKEEVVVAEDELKKIENDSDYFKDNDGSIHNGSSIAFILKYKETNVLFLGDAYPSVVIKGLSEFDYTMEKPLDANFVKVAHHGSINNTNYHLLKTINSNRYVLSTNGSYYQHPDKRCCARIFNNNSKAVININYEDRIDLFFTPQDQYENPELKIKGITEIEL